MTNVGEIEAVLRLNATGFTEGINESTSALNKFANATKKLNESKPANAMMQLDDAMSQLESTLMGLDGVSNKSLGTFSKLSNAINKMAQGLQLLQSDSLEVDEAINTMNSIFNAFKNTLTGVEIKVNAVGTSFKKMKESAGSTDTTLKQMQSDLMQMAQGVGSFNVDVKISKIRSELEALRSEHQRMESTIISQLKAMDVEYERQVTLIREVTVAVEQLGISEEKLTGIMGQLSAETFEVFGAMREMATATSGFDKAKVDIAGVVAEEEKLVASTIQSELGFRRLALSSNSATASTNRLSSATSRLSKGFSSLRSMGVLVGSMLVYNFAHSLITTTRETVNAKSEMEGYFKMLHCSQSDINHFNKKLDETVSQFQRINKYSLGETISSIGVEFDLTTKEMEKAMPVVSMITSEYLRAGRNANEASLAVKDILQGEFQRLSRETGVKGDQLKEAGWSGDKTDVMGLLEALDKVGKARNWDEFVVKANSLNDAVLIMQNRFGEWSADMVNVVQPTILSVFNSLMSNAQGLSEALGGFWKWINTDDIGATAVKIGSLVSAITVLGTALTMWRGKTGLLQASQLGLRKSLGTVIFGLNAEKIATYGVIGAIKSKILGVSEEVLAEKGLGGILQENIIKKKLLEVETTKDAIASTVNAESKQKEIFALTEDSLAYEENALAKRLDILLSAEQTASNEGLIASLYMLGTEELYVASETGALATAWGVLNGVFMLSPLGWLTAGLLALAGAFYVLSGGLDDSWGKMKKFHEAMKDPDAIMEKQYDRLERLKKNVGETSDEYLKAKDSVDEFYKNLQSSKAQYDKSEEDYESIGVGVDTNVKEVLKNNGIDESEAKKFVARYGYLSEGKRKYYEADQVLNKQIHDSNSNFAKDYDELVKNMDTNSDEFKDASDKLIGNYENLAEHSYIANTTDDWWEWMWNSLYAGLDQFWIDWDKFWGEQTKAFNTGDILTLIFGKDTDEYKDFSWLFDQLSGIGEYLSSHTLMEILGLDANTDYVGDFFNWISESFWSGVNGFIESITSGGDGGGTSVVANKINIGQILGSIIDFTSSFDVGGWLASVFNLDGVISYFSNGLNGIVSRVTSTVSIVTGYFSNLKTNIQTHLTNIVTNVTNGFNSVKNNAVSKITAMKDSVKGVIDKMVGAWNTMKDSILNASKKIQDGVKAKFDSVKDTIGGFYHKLTNPSEWFSGSAGQQSYSRTPRPATARRVIKSTGLHGAGSPNPYGSTSRQISLNELVARLGGDKRVDLNSFLSLFANSGFGGWDFSKKHKDTIYGKAKTWRADSPSWNGITLGNGYPMDRFWYGSAKGFTWNEFMATAQAIFSAIPYKFYMDSDWKGSWVGALLSGAVNCSDGADALLALASLFGFSGEKVHTTLKDGVGHFFTIINGHKMDTTAFQQHGSWSPLGGAGVPTRSYVRPRSDNNSNQATVNITVDMSNSNIYGVDDLDNRIENGLDKGLQKYFNDPYTVNII